MPSCHRCFTSLRRGRRRQRWAATLWASPRERGGSSVMSRTATERTGTAAKPCSCSTQQAADHPRPGLTYSVPSQAEIPWCLFGRLWTARRGCKARRAARAGGRSLGKRSGAAAARSRRTSSPQDAARAPASGQEPCPSCKSRCIPVAAFCSAKRRRPKAVEAQ